MKKNLIALIIVFITNSGFSQESKTDLKTYDPNLVGCWKGSETGQQIKGLSKYWVSCRYTDGTSILLFIAIDKNGEVIQETENGKWWTANGKYYELHYTDNVTDIYDYKVTVEDNLTVKNWKIGKSVKNWIVFSCSK